MRAESDSGWRVADKRLRMAIRGRTDDHDAASGGGRPREQSRAAYAVLAFALAPSLPAAFATAPLRSRRLTSV